MDEAIERPTSWNHYNSLRPEVPSAVHIDRRARYVGAGIRAQHADDAGDVFRFSRATQGQRIDEQLLRLGRRHAPRGVGDTLGLDVARRDGIHGDAERPELERERLGEADDAALSGGVMHTDAIGASARGDRGEVDDSPALLRLHARSELAADKKGAGQISCEHRAPLALVDVLEAE